MKTKTNDALIKIFWTYLYSVWNSLLKRSKILDTSVHSMTGAIFQNQTWTAVE